MTLPLPTSHGSTRHALFWLDHYHVDGIRVDVLYVGPAHTSGDAVVHLPERGILFGGDVLWNGCTPIGWEGSYAQWYAAIDRILALEPRIVVPGHGGITDVEGVRTLRRYFEFVESESKRFCEAGVPEFEAAKRIDLGPFAKWRHWEVHRIEQVVQVLAERTGRNLLRQWYRGRADNSDLGPPIITVRIDGLDGFAGRQKLSQTGLG